MGQVNVTYDDGLLRRPDALAETQGVTRSDLLRSLAEEAVRANEQGRTLFEPAEQPVSADMAIALVHEVKELSTYLDRLMRAAEKREKHLLQACNATEEANRTARERIGKDLASAFRDGATPFTDHLARLKATLAEKHDAILAATRDPESLVRLRADISEVKGAIRRSRRELHFHFGPRRSFAGWEVGVWVSAGLAMLTVAQILIASILPYGWVATPVALRLYGSSDVAICELYKQSRMLRECPSLAPAKTGGQR